MDQSGSFDPGGKKPVRLNFLCLVPVSPTLFFSCHTSPPPFSATDPRGDTQQAQHELQTEKKLDFTKGTRNFEHHPTLTTRQEHYMYVCMYVCMYVFVCVCIRIYVCIQEFPKRDVMPTPQGWERNYAYLSWCIHT